jgi:flagellar M-ring protein FliF
MPAQLTGLVGRLRKTVAAFTVAQRTLAVLAAAVLLLGAFALSAWLSKPTMTPLFANLSATDASAIVDQLDSQAVAYELADGGSTILVPADKVYAMRLAVAAAGLPSSSSEGGGYSLLDNVGVTSSEFQQQVTYQRAVEGELAKTIGAIDGVETATVRLAIPDETVFASEVADPTASVFVRTEPGLTLGSQAVQAIVNLVSSGVEGMTPEGVTVVDASGRMLSAAGGQAAGGLQSGQSADYESRVAANIQQMLDRVVGAGNAVVTVTAELDFDQAARTTETYTATEDLPPISSATTSEEYTGTGQTVGGVLGVDGTLVDPTAGGGGTYAKSSETVNNPINKVTEQLTTAPGSLSRQSVAVVVSDAVEGLDVQGLEESVAAAAGIDTGRGDVVSVTRMTFDTSAAAAAEEALTAAETDAAAQRTTDLTRTGAIAGAAVLAVVLLLVLGRRRGKKDRREAIDLGELQMLEAAKAEALEAAERARALPAAPVEADPVIAKRDDVLALAAEQPAEVAEVLRGWLVGGRR